MPRTTPTPPTQPVPPSRAHTPFSRVPAGPRSVPRVTASRPRRAVSLVDVVVVLVLVALLVALWASTVSKTRERSRRQRCMGNLHMIANALTTYRQVNGGRDPRTIYAPSARPDVSGAGAAAPDPFGMGGPPPNNVPAALFLLLRAGDLRPEQLVCPSAGDRFRPDDFAGLDVTARSNFTDVRRNLGYSFFYPYTAAQGAAPVPPAGTPPGAAAPFTPSGMPVAADLNPGAAASAVAFGRVAAADIAADPARYRAANSNTHGKAGQLVMYDDYRVIWYTTPFAGVLSGNYPDNISTTRKDTVVDTPADAQDTILLPADE